MIHLPTRNDLGTLVRSGAIGAEVGVWRGYYSLEILKWPVKKLYLVDSWAPLGPQYNDPLSEADHEDNFRQTKDHLKGHLPGGRVEIVRCKSLDAIQRVPMLDFCYLDADHSYESTLTDLLAWSGKMQPGGLLCGHDWTDNTMSRQHHWGVRRAVEDFCAETNWKMTHVTDEDFASFVLQR